MTPAALAVFRCGFEHAVRLGHPSLGCEHLLLALTESEHPIAARLRAHGLRPDLVREQLTARAGGAVFGDLDAAALTAIGIDLEAVRAQALASFGPEGLSRAGAAIAADAALQTGQPGHRATGAGWSARRPAAVARTGPGAWDRGTFRPHSPDLGELLDAAHRRGLLEPTAPVGLPDLAVGVLSVGGGAVPTVLTALGLDAPTLRAAVAETGEPGGA